MTLFCTQRSIMYKLNSLQYPEINTITIDETYSVEPLKNNTEFEKDAPFKFIVDQSNLEVLQYEDYSLEVNIEGAVRPKEVFIDVEGYQYRLKENNQGKAMQSVVT